MQVLLFSISTSFEKNQKKVSTFHFITIFAPHLTHGRLAEWLGTGLQNRLQRFESATALLRDDTHIASLFLTFFCYGYSL